MGSTFEYKDLSVGASEFFLAYIVPSFVSVGLCGVSYNTDGKLGWATLATVSQQEFSVEFFSLVHNYSSEELKISCLNICFFLIIMFSVINCFTDFFYFYVENNGRP